MKRATTPPDLFTPDLLQNSTPKLLPKLPTTAQEESQLRAELWETAPRHVKGVVRGEDCIYLDARWQPVATLNAAELILCFSLS